MTSRERVAAALNHQLPDRVPTALGGGPYGIVDELYYELLDYLDLGQPVDPFRQGHNITYLDDRLFARLGVDTRYVWPGASPSSASTPTQEPDVFLDGYGQPWLRAFPYYYPAEGILADVEDAAGIEEVVQWPDPADPLWTEGVRERARYLCQETDAYVIGRMVTSHGPFQTASSLRGTEQFLLDLAINPAFAGRLIERVGQAIDGLLRVYLEAGGPFFDMIELPGDDYAGNEQLLISPGMWRELVRPALQRLINTVKEYRPDLKVMLHSDGNITRLLPDFVEMGVDVVHPLEPVSGIDQEAIKAQFGERLAFLGGIDISHAMPGSQEAVVAEVKQRIATLGPGGGYVLAPSNHLQADVPPQNVVTLFEAARRYGQYPLRLDP